MNGNGNADLFTANLGVSGTTYPVEFKEARSHNCIVLFWLSYFSRARTDTWRGSSVQGPL